ncbi:MAG: GNAT family N-acetyltransferase [Ruminococcaceae bacterium]|nr:GNAT family N-acetyltransferase [Oscillospiraceae bacterium]
MEIRIAKKSDIEKVYALRHEVFVNEQNVPPEIEIDEEDDHATHIIAVENGTAVGCARVLFGEDGGHIGRLAVKKNERGRGIGKEICRFIIEICRERGYKRVWLNSQLHAVGFYEKLGFSRRGETFFEAGIEHIEMELI